MCPFKHQDTLPPSRGKEVSELQSAVPDSEFRFLHDRVQQAAYALIPDGEKKAVHLKVGRLILQHSDEAEREEKLFDIVNHLNVGSELITDETERAELARLNLAAGREAKSSTAYEAALGYLNSGIRLITEDHWETDYELVFALHIEAVECKYLCGHFEDAECDFEPLLSKARTSLDKAQMHSLRSVQYENMSRYNDAVRCGREGLALFGVLFPDSPEGQQAALQAEVSTIQALMGDRTIDSLADLPVSHDPELQILMKLLASICSPAYLGGELILSLLINATMVRLSLVHGNTHESAYSYVTYAITVGPVLGDYRTALDFGQLAFRVNELLPDPRERARIHQVFQSLINLWRMPMETCLPHSREASRISLETGSFAYVSYAVLTESWYAFLTSKELGQFVRDYSPNIALLKKLKMADVVENQKVILNWALALQGAIPDRLFASDRDYNEDAFLRDHMSKSHFLTFLNVATLHLCLTFEEYEMALEAARAARETAHFLQGLIWPVLLDFLGGVALAAVYSDSDEDERRSYLVELESTSTRLGVLAENCPENFLCWSLLTRAELARITDRAVEAMPLYEKAISYAGERENLMNASLANELYARFWRERRDKEMAGLYLREAYKQYKEWGATAKVKDLEEKYSLSLFSVPARTCSGEPLRSDLRASSSTIGISSESLDLMTVIKASWAISSELVLDRLVEKLMKIAIQNAGAQKGILILEKEGKMVAEARGSADRDEIAMLHSTPVGASYAPALPQTILNYVRRTHESVVLSHAADDIQFGKDPYVSQMASKSILCTPILNQAKLTGILYLENSLATDAFTPDRIQVVQILLSQAAVSLENARLYDESRRTADELRFLNDLVEQTDQPVTVVNFDGHFVRFNRAFQQLTGYSSDELYRMAYQQLTPESWHQIEAEHVARLIKEGTAVRYEKEYRRKDGTLVPLELVADIYRNASGERVYLYAFVTDITERKRAEQALRERTERTIRYQAALLEVAKMDSSDLDRALKKITEVDSKTLGVERVGVWFFSEDRSEIVCRYLYTMSENSHESGLRVEAGDYPLLYFQELEKNRTVAAKDAHTDPRTSEFAEEGYLKLHGIASMMGVPVRLHGELAGVVCHEHTGEIREWTVEEQDFAASIADMVSLALEARERKRAEDALEYRVKFGNVVSSLSTHFIDLASDEIDNGINYALKTIGEFAGVDRSYIFLYRKGLPVDTLPWIMGKLKKGEVVHIPRVADLPPEASAEKEHFESQEIRSLVVISLVFGKFPIGFLGFDSVLTAKTWSEDTIDLLRIVGEMFTNAFQRKNAEEALKESFAQLSKKNRYETIIGAVTRSVHRSIALQDVLENAVQSMSRNMDRADIVEIYVIENKEAVLKAHVGYQSSYIERAERIPYPKGFIWKTAIEEKPLYCADVDQDTVIGPAGRAAGIKSYLSMPIRFEDKIFGVIGINSFQKDVFDEEEIKLLEIVSRQIETAVNNAKQAEALQKALEEVEQLKNRLQVENIYLQEEIKTEHNFEEIVGKSEPLVKLLHKVEQVARTDATVLIFGETGTGKELIARAIHNLSPRKDRPLVKVNCGAISAGLVESELFGHEKGAFTGALQRRIGRFELADGGTIFLDEVSELPLDTQTKLLRVLQEGELERVGSSKPVKVDVRVIAATNRDLEEAVRMGAFRSDLFYRLNVFPLYVPPLRERKSDIPHLVYFFITKFSKRLGKEFNSVSKETMDQLMSYSWPGNIRELQNVIERAVVLSTGSEVRIDVGEPLRQGSTEMPVERPVVSTVEKPVSIPVDPSDGDSYFEPDVRSQRSVKKILEETERANILRVLERTNWVVEGKRGAAGVLDMNPSTLRSRMRKLGIKKP